MRSLLVSAILLVAVILAPCALVACYDANTPLPPCSASPTACGGYPEPARTCVSIGSDVDLDSGVQDDAGGWHYKGHSFERPCDAGHS